MVWEFLAFLAHLPAKFQAKLKHEVEVFTESPNQPERWLDGMLYHPSKKGWVLIEYKAGELTKSDLTKSLLDNEYVHLAREKAKSKRSKLIQVVMVAEGFSSETSDYKDKLARLADIPILIMTYDTWTRAIAEQYFKTKADPQEKITIARKLGNYSCTKFPPSWVNAKANEYKASITG